MQIRIYQPSKSATQSGRGRTHYWLIEPVLETKRAPESLNGWTAAGDTLVELTGKLKFDSADEAAAFALSRGWEIADISAPHLRKAPKSNYLDNFKYQSPVAPVQMNPGSPPDKTPPIVKTS